MCASKNSEVNNFCEPVIQYFSHLYRFKKEHVAINCRPIETKCRAHSLSVLTFITFPWPRPRRAAPANKTQIINVLKYARAARIYKMMYDRTKSYQYLPVYKVLGLVVTA